MADQNASIISGDTKTLDWAVTTSAGTPVDVSTAAAVTWVLAAAPYSTPILTKTLGSGITISTSTVSVALTAANTASLDGLYYMEMQITDASGNIQTRGGWLNIGRDAIT